MKYIFTLLVICMLGCKRSSKQPNPIKPANEKYLRLLSKFNEISFDTLAVNSMNDNNGEKYKYEGVELDSADAILFPQEISEAHFSSPPGLFACYKFSVDSGKTCLIARTPSEYSPTSIKLFLYTPGKDTLIQLAELAEFSGDAGAFIDINSWIYKTGENKYKAFIWLVDGMDNSVEDPNDKTISTYHHFSLYDISANKQEELDTAIGKLPIQFQRLVKSKLK